MKSVSRALVYLKNYWPTALGGAAALTLVSLANLATPQLLRSLIDRGITSLDMQWVLWIALLLVAVALIKGVFNFLQGYWGEITSQGVAYDLRNVIFKKLQSLSFSYHDQAQTGRLMTRMTSDVELVRTFIGMGLLQLISALVLLIGSLILMFIMSWKLTLVVMLMIPFIVVIMIAFIRQIMPISKRVQQKLGSLNTILQENLAGMRIVKAFAREEFEKDRYKSKNAELLDENVSLVQLFTKFFPGIFFIANMAVVAILWFGGFQVIDDQLTLGQLVAFTGYLAFLMMPMFMMGMIGASMSRAEASSQRIFEVIDAESEVMNKTDASKLPAIRGEVVFDQVSFRYIGAEQDVLSNLSFTAKPGQTIAILGETGSGKSTIINLIPRFYDVTDGKIMVDKYDIRDVTIDSLRGQVGIVLQETTLFSGTISENIAYGNPEADLSEIQSAAMAAQAHDFITEFPDGYGTVVGERGVGLSGGQKQRIAIARALLVDPKILILDDSTSSVDAETEYKIQAALEKLMVGRTSFLIAQRISTVRNADLILLLEQGKLVASGQHEDLMQTSELYAEILETQFGDRSELISAIEKEMAI